MTPDHIQLYHMRIVHFNAIIKINNIAVCRVQWGQANKVHAIYHVCNCRLKESWCARHIREYITARKLCALAIKATALTSR